jgi:hypothetical protein
MTHTLSPFGVLPPVPLLKARRGAFKSGPGLVPYSTRIDKRLATQKSALSAGPARSAASRTPRDVLHTLRWEPQDAKAVAIFTTFG